MNLYEVDKHGVSLVKWIAVATAIPMWFESTVGLIKVLRYIQQLIFLIPSLYVGASPAVNVVDVI